MQAHARSGQTVTVVVGILALSSFAFLAWVVVSPIALPFQRVNATIRMTSIVDGQTMRVTGATNLPDGSLIDWDIDQESFMGPPDPPAGQVAVQGGAFAFDADLTPLVSGSARVEVWFSCNYGTAQPARVTAIVGDSCEHLGGEQVYVDSPGDAKQLLAPIEFAVP